MSKPFRDFGTALIVARGVKWDLLFITFKVDAMLMKSFPYIIRMVQEINGFDLSKTFVTPSPSPAKT